MRVLFGAVLAAITLPTCSSFQQSTPFPIRSTLSKASVHQNGLKVPPRGGATQLALGVNGDNKATSIFSIDGKLAKTSALIAGTVATYVLHNQVASMGPVQASGIVGLFSTLLLPEKLALAALCGSFAGMAKAAVVPTMFSAGLLGVTCAGMLSLFDRKACFVGFGGRLGFIAQCACTFQFLLFKYGQRAWQAIPALETTLGVTSPTAKLVDFSLYEMTTGSIKAQVPPLVLFTVAGALFMRLWKHLTSRLPNKISNSVAAVSMTGLLGGLYLPASIAGPAFCGSFVAMSSPTILPSLVALVLASILAGVSQLGLTGMLLGGWGGKLGTAAFMGVLGYRLLVKATNEVALAANKKGSLKTANKPSKA